tara:strand:- start:169 stop:471 length:303 start_codon:yes stop_codon:yes gene_type:complete
MAVKRYYSIEDDVDFYSDDEIEKKLPYQEYMLLKFSESLNAINSLQIVNIENEAYPYTTRTCSKIIKAMRELQSYLLLSKEAKAEHYNEHGETDAFEELV